MGLDFWKKKKKNGEDSDDEVDQNDHFENLFFSSLLSEVEGCEDEEGRNEDSLSEEGTVLSDHNEITAEEAPEIGMIARNTDKEFNSEIISVREGLEQLHHDFIRLYQKFEDEISYTERKDHAVIAMREELNAYRENLGMKIIQGILYDVIDIREGVISQITHERKDGNTQIDLDEVEYMTDDIADILKKNSVTVFRTKAGEKFDPNKHRIVKKIHTEQLDQVHTIKESLTCGYTYNEKVLYPEKVVVYFAE